MPSPTVQIRQAVPSDYPSFVRGIARWRVRWGIEIADSRPGMTNSLKGDMLEWLMDNIDHENITLYMAWDGDELVGVCGGMMRRLILPPHYLHVAEWVWWIEDGVSPRVAVTLWRAVEKWGVNHGARMSDRSSMQATRRGWEEFHTLRRV